MDKLFSLPGQRPRGGRRHARVGPEPRSSLLVAAEEDPTPQDGSDPNSQARDWFILIRAPFRPHPPSLGGRSCLAPT